jgi:1-acyl-sn-glycerol-3-phosphate acyltransferase
VIAAQHGVDIVPIYVFGTHEAMPPGQNWPKRKRGRLFSRRHKVEVRFGAPVRCDDPAQRREAMAAVQEFWDRNGLPAEPAEQPVSHDVLLIHKTLAMHEAATGALPAPRFDRILQPAPEPGPDRSTTAA